MNLSILGQLVLILAGIASLWAGPYSHAELLILPVLGLGLVLLFAGWRREEKQLREWRRQLGLSHREEMRK